MVAIETILALERLDADLFRGAAGTSQLQRIFGGQVAGQALVSATETVAEHLDVHSLHGYFIRAGDPDQPTIYRVERIRDGRSYSTRRVDGIQDGRVIFTMAASFTRPSEGLNHQDSAPVVPRPSELEPSSMLSEPQWAAVMREWENVELVIVPPEARVVNPTLAAQQAIWFRYRHTLPDRRALHVCTLAYMSDILLLQSATVNHPHENPQNASLDHAMWFLRPFRADEWLLYDQTSPSAAYGRALTQGRIFDSSGRLIAAVTQEGLARTGRPLPRDQHAR